MTSRNNEVYYPISDAEIERLIMYAQNIMASSTEQDVESIIKNSVKLDNLQWEIKERRVVECKECDG